MNDSLLNAFTSLVKKLEEIDGSEENRSVWIYYTTHGMRYAGPTYADELKVAQNALKNLPEQSDKTSGLLSSIMVALDELPDSLSDIRKWILEAQQDG